MSHREPITTKSYTYTVVFEEDENAGGYCVTCPALPGVVTEGDTLAEARERAREAIELYLEALEEAGHPIPVESNQANKVILEKVTVTPKPV